MSKVHDRLKAKAQRLHTVSLNDRILAAANNKPDTARRMSVLLQDIDMLRRCAHSARRHELMQRAADEAKALGLKGRWNLLCNRTQCLREPALYYNRGSHAFYCATCAHDLSSDPFNRRDAEKLFGGPLCVLVETAEAAAELHVSP